jgi:hypothetical protein
VWLFGAFGVALILLLPSGEVSFIKNSRAH